MEKRNRQKKTAPKDNLDQPVEFSVGQPVVVKAGTKDPDSGLNIGSWQGRVTEIQANKTEKRLITIQWDSLSLKKMSVSKIQRFEEDGLDWTSMCLYSIDIEPAEERDTQDDVDELTERLTEEHAWDYLGKQGHRIYQVVKNSDDDDEMDVFEAWEQHLTKSLKLPFDAFVSESQDRGPLHAGDLLTVTSFEGVEEMYGVLAHVIAKHKNYVFPLCDLEAANEKSYNYMHTNDYAVWFANR